MKVYSFRQMQDAGIRVDNYKANEREGVFIATLDVKRWGKGRNILAYFTFEDGSKIMAAAWQNTGYLGLPDIEEGVHHLQEHTIQLVCQTWFCQHQGSALLCSCGSRYHRSRQPL